ncbi:hypothetical protein ACFPYJ_31250 [Paenibacillus solisilvae]|uniref:Uncharacterized protein n=1 Tax=Paenibacillus solisilvae TaxID=2486751 RepID=A0ABW0W925_9BACL
MEEENKNAVAQVQEDADYLRWKRELRSVLFYLGTVTIFLLAAYYFYKK